MAKREYTMEEGGKFYEVTVTSPEPGSIVTLKGVVPSGDTSMHDLDNIPVMVGDRSITVPAVALKECVSRKEIPAPRRLDEPVEEGKGKGKKAPEAV